MSADAAESSTNSLMRFTSEGSTLSSSELDLAVSVIDKLSKRQLVTTMDDVTAEAILEVNTFCLYLILKAYLYFEKTSLLRFEGENTKKLQKRYRDIEREMENYVAYIL